MLHRLATTSRADVLIGASANHLAVFPLSDAHPDQLVASTVDRPKDEAHTGLVRTLTVYEGGDGLKLVTTAEDKALKVWDLPELKLRSSRYELSPINVVARRTETQRVSQRTRKESDLGGRERRWATHHRRRQVWRHLRVRAELAVMSSRD